MLIPRVSQFLLQPQADPFFLAIDVQDHDIDVLAHLEQLGGVADPAPAHVRDMEQAVDSVQIDERAEIGDVLDRAFADVARRHFGKQLLPAFQAFLLDQLAP